MVSSQELEILQHRQKYELQQQEREEKQRQYQHDLEEKQRQYHQELEEKRQYQMEKQHEIENMRFEKQHEMDKQHQLIRELQDKQIRHQQRKTISSADSMPDLSQHNMGQEYERWKARHGLTMGRSMKKGLSKLQHASNTLC